MTANYRNSTSSKVSAKRIPLITATALVLSLGVAGCSFSVENNVPEKEVVTASKEETTAENTEGEETEVTEPDAVLENTLKEVHDLAYGMGEELPGANETSTFIMNNELTITLTYGENAEDEEGYYTSEPVRSVEETYTIPEGVELDLDLSLSGLTGEEVTDEFAVVKGWHEDSETYNSEETAMVYPSEGN